ncbi:MAG: hypothetical protein WB715_11990 [Roseiarcus sp.]|uniref:hypothetical protein n=1 Tax=Roseiarcus sp. TaxID=1969460 RepID=UPI003C4FAE10
MALRRSRLGAGDQTAQRFASASTSIEERGPRMKTADFVVAKRPKLSAIARFPELDFSDYEHGLTTVQETLQRVQQAYLGRNTAL